MSNPAELADQIQDEMAGYFEHLGRRVEKMVRALPREKLWVKPFSFGNSIGHLVLHLTGNLNHYIGAEIAGTGYVRERPVEFSDPTQYPTEDLLGRFQEAIQMVVRTLKTQGATGLLAPMTKEQQPVHNRFGLFLVCCAHLNNHIGQMAYLMHAHGHGSDERSW